VQADEEPGASAVRAEVAKMLEMTRR
jgi:hypothetical protein